MINFCAVDLSALYLDVAKDRLYCSAAAAPERRAGQTAIWTTLDLLARLMAPILSYTADEIWSYLPGEKASSVFEAGLPPVHAEQMDEALAEKWERLLALRSAVTKALEAERQAGTIGHSLDARVRLHGTGGWRELLEEQRDDLPALLIVSQVHLDETLGEDAASPVLEGARVGVERASGAKCERCWNYSDVVGSDHEHPGLCGRCLSVVRT